MMAMSSSVLAKGGYGVPKRMHGSFNGLALKALKSDPPNKKTGRSP